MTEAEGPAGGRLRAALAASGLPRAVRRAWEGTPPAPEPGQVWRARWGTITLLLLILEATSRAVRAAPVTLDVAAVDDSAVLIPQEASELAVPLAVWLEDSTSLPLRVLDRHLGALTVTVTDLSEARRGRPVLSAADDRAVLRAQRQDALDVLATARWAPEGDGNLKNLLGPAMKDLGDLLGIPNRTVIALGRGIVALTPEQAERLAPVVGHPAERLLAANPALPEDLVADLDLPAYRAKVVRLARRRGIDEIQAWLTTGFAVAAVAHRQTEGEAPSWTERLDRYFSLVLDEQ